MLDAWLLQRFPGRTLDELDQMDWFRFWRALEADRIRIVEQKHRLYLDQKIEPDALTMDDWTALKEHDELLRQYGTR